MIGKLRGILIEKQPPEILVDVNGVHYEVQLPMTSIYQLPDTDNEVVLFTHLAVTETAQQLFGFCQRHDRELFRTLIKVNGVGPRMALAILSGMETDAIVRCVRDDNSAALVKVPGVGKKTAERLIIELRDRLKEWNVPEHHTASTAAASTPITAANDNSITAEAESALIALGYKPTQASQMVLRVLKDQSVERTEDLIRLALRNVAS